LEYGSEYLFSSFSSDSCTNLLLGGNWFPCSFHLPIIALAIVTAPVLCAIKYFLARNNNNCYYYLEWKGERRGKAKKVKKKGKINNKTNKQITTESSAKEIIRER
jgi:hypothetical protein